MPHTFAVGRTAWSAADAPVGVVVIPISLIHQLESGSRGTRADQGVRPTLRRAIPGLGKSMCPAGRRGGADAGDGTPLGEITHPVVE